MHAPLSKFYRVEWRDVAALKPLADEIRALAARAAEPNVFYEPAFMLAAAPVFGARVGATLVRTSTGRLAGVFPARKERPRGGTLAMLTGWTHPFAPLGVPLVAAIVGEGGSGGAVALASGNRVLMFEHAVYSVISPEGCASILWKDADKMREAAEALKLTAQDLKKLGVIDAIIPEPLGGAQRAPADAVTEVGREIARLLSELKDRKPAELIRARRQKFLDMGSRGLAA